MRIIETAKFRKQRGSLHSEEEKESLKKAILQIMADPASGKKLNGALVSFNSCRCAIAGRPQRLVYRCAADTLILFSLGPRHGTSKP
jgi:hypothetical protein